MYWIVQSSTTKRFRGKTSEHKKCIKDAHKNTNISMFYGKGLKCPIKGDIRRLVEVVSLNGS